MDTRYPLYSIPHFSFTITGFPVRPFRNGLGFSGTAWGAGESFKQNATRVKFSTTYSHLSKISPVSGFLHTHVERNNEMQIGGALAGGGSAVFTDLIHGNKGINTRAFILQYTFFCASSSSSYFSTKSCLQSFEAELEGGVTTETVQIIWERGALPYRARCEHGQDRFVFCGGAALRVWSKRPEYELHWWLGKHDWQLQLSLWQRQRHWERWVFLQKNTAAKIYKSALLFA